MHTNPLLLLTFFASEKWIRLFGFRTCPGGLKLLNASEMHRWDSSELQTLILFSQTIGSFKFTAIRDLLL